MAGAVARTAVRAEPPRERSGARRDRSGRKSGAEERQATEAGLDLLRVLGWLVLHDVALAGMPDVVVDHLAAGPSGVYVINSVEATGPVEIGADTLHCKGADQAHELDAVSEAAEMVRALVEGRPVAALLCFSRGEDLTGLVEGVAVCSTENVLDVLTGQAARLDGAAQAAVARVLRESVIPAGESRKAPEPLVVPEPAKVRRGLFKKAPAERVVEPVVESVVEPVVVEPVVESVVEPVAVEPVVESVVELAAEHVVEPADLSGPRHLAPPVPEDSATGLVAEAAAPATTHVEEAAQEQATREQGALEQAAREDAAREQAAREQAAREQAAREQAARQEAAREEVAREQAARAEAARLETERLEAERRALAEERAQVESARAEALAEARAATERRRQAALEEQRAIAAERRAAAEERSRIEAEQREERARIEAEQRAAAEERARIEAEHREALAEQERIAAERKRVAKERRLAQEAQARAQAERRRAVAERKAAEAAQARVEKERKIAERREAERAERERQVVERVTADLASSRPEVAEVAAAMGLPARVAPPPHPYQPAAAPAAEKKVKNKPRLGPGGIKVVVAAAILIGLVAGLAPRTPGAVYWVKAQFGMVEPTAAFGGALSIPANAYHPDLQVVAGTPARVRLTAGSVPRGDVVIAVPLRVTNTTVNKWVLPLGAQLVAIDSLGLEHHPTREVTRVVGAGVLGANLRLGAGGSASGDAVFAIPGGRSIKELRLVFSSVKNDRAVWHP